MIISEKTRGMQSRRLRSTILAPLYMTGGAVPGVIPASLTACGFGDKRIEDMGHTIPK